MAHREIKHKNKALTIHKAVCEPHFNEKTILVTSTWDYIDLWLKRNHQTDAQYFWQQAKHFYHATTELPKDSSPLTAYYCMLNAAKAFLFAYAGDSDHPFRFNSITRHSQRDELMVSL